MRSPFRSGASHKEAPFFMYMNDLPVEFVDYLTKPENLIIAACFVVGRIAKGIPHIPDWTLPIIVAIAGIIQGWCFIGGDRGAAIGFVYSAIATYGHQTIKQILDRTNTISTSPTEKPSNSENKP